MVTDMFGALLQELGRAIQNPKLHPDEHNTCLLKFKGGVKVHIEPNKEGTHLIIGTDLGTVAPGRYRENVFGEALKANGLPIPRFGTFAYSTQKDHLVLFEMLPLRELTGDKVADFLPRFLEKARVWREALAKNEVPVVATAYTSKPLGLFGLIR